MDFVNSGLCTPSVVQQRRFAAAWVPGLDTGLHAFSPRLCTKQVEANLHRPQTAQYHGRRLMRQLCDWYRGMRHGLFM